MALLLAACARDPAMKRWTDDVAIAERMLDDGKVESARVEFQRLERLASSPADVRTMRLRQAEALRRQQRWDEADALLVLVLRTPELAVAQRAKAHYLRARIALDRGDVAGGEARLRRVIDHFPSSVYAHRAFEYLRGELRERDPAALLDWCREEYRKHPDSGLADNFAYEAGRIYFERGEDDRALELYALVMKRWRFETSGLWDDALWETSLIRHKRREFPAEIALLDELLSHREETWIGSYEIRNFKYAALRLARIYHDDLKDYERAAKAFHAFPIEFPNSLFKDDALWYEAWSWQKAGRTEEAKAAFTRLAAEYPDSKYTRRVQEGRPGPDPDAPPFERPGFFRP